MRKLFIILFFSIFLIGKFDCNSKINLSAQGIPIVFPGPETVEISEGFIHGEFDGYEFINYEIKKNKYLMNVLMEADEMTYDIELYLDLAKKTEKKEDNFINFIIEEKNGYIAKLKSIDGNFTYSFYCVMIKNNRVIEFTEGINFDNYSLEEIKILYDSARKAR